MKLRTKMKFGGLLAVLLGVWFAFSWNQPRPSSPRIQFVVHRHVDQELGVIFFIHGIGGDAEGTWENSDGALFPELLAKDPLLSRYSIASIGYQTAILGDQPSLISTIAERLARRFESDYGKTNHVFVVAHSMGGIIARQALSSSGFESRSTQFVTLITLASPFSGSDLPRLGRPLHSFGLSSDQLDSLRPLERNDFLNVLSAGWGKLVKTAGVRLEQFAAAEGRKINPLPRLVVERESAFHDVTAANCWVATDEDHLSIAKPKSLDAGIGKQVRDWILASSQMRHLHGDMGILREDLVQPEATLLTIDPGTTLRFAPGKCLDSRGKVMAIGTKEAPIRFEFLHDGAQEGAILLQGHGADGSRFEHCEFRDGSGIHLDKPDPPKRKESREQLFSPPMTRRTAEASMKGGAIAIIGCDDVYIGDSLFEGNEAYIGGALLVLGSAETSLKHCRFLRNRSGYGGGAVFSQMSAVYVTDCWFEGNETGNLDLHAETKGRDPFACGGAIYFGFDSYFELEDCTFLRNQAAWAGGAVYCCDLDKDDRGPGGAEDGKPSVMIKCEFRAGLGARLGGSAIWLDDQSRLKIEDSRFVDNSIGAAGISAPIYDKSVMHPRHMTTSSGLTLLEAGLPYRGATALVYRPPSIAPAPEITVSLMENPASFARTLDGERFIDTIVLHHISAINWFDPAFRSQFGERIAAWEKAAGVAYQPEQADEFKYDWRLCKEILELYAFSAHYLVARDGTIRQLVGENDVAMHAGKSIMPAPDNQQNVNAFSIGIELVASHPDDDAAVKAGATEAYTKEQYAALDQLLLHLVRKYKLRINRIVGHDDIAGTRAVEMGIRPASEIKKDPGQLFDWTGTRQRLAASVSEPPREEAGNDSSDAAAPVPGGQNR